MNKELDKSAEGSEGEVIRVKKKMKANVLLNKLDGKWWLELGISYEPNNLFEYKKVISIAFIFFTIYIRFNKIKKK